MTMKMNKPTRKDIINAQRKIDAILPVSLALYALTEKSELVLNPEKATKISDFSFWLDGLIEDDWTIAEYAAQVIAENFPDTITAVKARLKQIENDIFLENRAIELLVELNNVRYEQLMAKGFLGSEIANIHQDATSELSRHFSIINSYRSEAEHLQAYLETGNEQHLEPTNLGHLVIELPNHQTAIQNS